jgi:uncharacterized membrane protein YgcG
VQFRPELSQSYHWILSVIGRPGQVAGTSVSVSPTWGGDVDANAREIPGGVPVGSASAPAANSPEPARARRAAKPKMEKSRAIARMSPPLEDCALPLYREGPWATTNVARCDATPDRRYYEFLSQPRVTGYRVMAGPTFSDRLVAKGIRAPALPHTIGVAGRTVLLMLAAPIVAFGIAFAAGAATVTTPVATHVKLVPATRSAQARLKILAVTSAPATPGLKTPPKPRAASQNLTVHPTPAVAVSNPAPVTPTVRPVTVPRTVVPSAPISYTTPPVASVPVRSPTMTGGGSSGSSGGSGSTSRGAGTSGGGSAGGTGTSTGGDSGSGTGTATGGG